MLEDASIYPGIAVGTERVEDDDELQVAIYFLDGSVLHTSAKAVLERLAHANSPNGQLVVPLDQFGKLGGLCKGCKLPSFLSYNEEGVIDFDKKMEVCIHCYLMKKGIAFEGVVDNKPIEQAVSKGKVKRGMVSNDSVHIIKIFSAYNLAYIGIATGKKVVYTDCQSEHLTKGAASQLQRCQAFVDSRGNIVAPILLDKYGPYGGKCKVCNKLAMDVDCRMDNEHGFAVGDVMQFKRNKEDGAMCIKCQVSGITNASDSMESSVETTSKLGKRRKSKSPKNFAHSSPPEDDDSVTSCEQGFKPIIKSVGNFLVAEGDIAIANILELITTNDTKCLHVVNAFYNDIRSMGATRDNERFYLPEYLDDKIVGIDRDSPQYLLYTIFKLVQSNEEDELENHPKCKKFIGDTINVLDKWHDKYYNGRDDTDECVFFGQFRGYYLKEKGKKRAKK